MDDHELSNDDYVRKETLISMAINGVLSAAFFLLVFGQHSSVKLWGVGSWVFDYLPQSFMIALMATIVPGAITIKRLKSGVLRPSSGSTRLPRSLFARALLLAIASAIIGYALVATLSAASGQENIGWSTAIGLKVLYGVLLAAIVTPIGLRATLSLSR